MGGVGKHDDQKVGRCALPLPYDRRVPFAVRNALEPLYEACLERITQAFVDDLDAGRLKSLQPARSLPAEANPESAQADFAGVARALQLPVPRQILRLPQNPGPRPCAYSTAATSS